MQFHFDHVFDPNIPMLKISPLYASKPDSVTWSQNHRLSAVAVNFQKLRT